MIVDLDWKAGIVFGLEADQIYLVDDDDNVAETPNQVWYVHLGVATLSLIFK